MHSNRSEELAWKEFCEVIRGIVGVPKSGDRRPAETVDLRAAVSSKHLQWYNQWSMTAKNDESVPHVYEVKINMFESIPVYKYIYIYQPNQNQPEIWFFKKN